MRDLKKRYWFLAIVVLVILINFMKPLPPETVSSMNFTNYKGTWYEIADFPMHSEVGCSCTQLYLAPSIYQFFIPYIKSANSCRAGSPYYGWRIVDGTARIVSDTNNSQIKIKSSWYPNSHFWILYVSPPSPKIYEDYQYSVAGSPDRKYLWILARTPKISEEKYRELVDVAKRQGYDVSKLVKTQQEANCPMMFETA